MDYSHSDGANEALPYLEPAVKNYVKDNSDMINDDYEDLPTTEKYENPVYEAPAVPYEYETSASTVTNNDLKKNLCFEPLPDGEQIYEDPGHKAQHIYAWFEERKFRKLKNDEIRFVHAHCKPNAYKLLPIHVEHCTNLDLVNLEWSILDYGLMALLIL